MAPSEKQPFYDPIPPTYDEALASGSHYDSDWAHHGSAVDARDAQEATGAESQSLLNRSNGAPSSSRRPDGYRAPTVESDNSDIESLLESDTDDEEADQVRREIQEMDIEEPSRSRGTLFGKPIGFSLPRWKWSWRPRMPRVQLPQLPRLRIQLPQEPPETTSTGENGNEGETQTQPQYQWNLPQVNGMLAVLVFARLLAVFIILGFVYLIFASDFFNSWGGPMNGGFRFNAEDLRLHILNSVDPARLRASVQHYSSYAHIAGSEGDYATAMDMESMFSRAGLDEVYLDEYIAYINYPKKDGRAIRILDKKRKDAIWTATLEETELGEETAGHQTYAFYGHSKDGEAEGHLVYANYGSRDDLKKLKDMKIKTEGAIALLRSSGTHSDMGISVKWAEEAGFVGCIIYSDPTDNGADKGKVAPKGRYMPEDGVQRGSLSIASWAIGDVLTPGWPSKGDMPRMKIPDVGNLPLIPALPLAWRDAKVLLEHLKGYGKKVPDEWKGSSADVKEWWTGDAKSPIVQVKNKQDENKRQPIWNVYGKIIGMEQTSKSIIIGNHRDAMAFGATDPHSGTAIMVEMARIFGDLIMRGWRPLRTIEFMSWDGGDYNFIGSTEFVEKNVDDLRDNAYAYINLDKAVIGNEFHAGGSPMLLKSLMQAMNRIADPKLNGTLKELWYDRGAELEGLAAHSDYVAFQDIAGTSCLDLEFRGDPYPAQSSYDNFDLVEQVIDPEFVYHGLMAQLMGLLVLDLADKAILPIDVTAYGPALEACVSDLEKWAGGRVDKDVNLSFKELKEAVKNVKEATEEFAKWEQIWDHAIMQNAGWETNDIGSQRFKYNDAVGNFDAALLDLEMGGGVSSSFRNAYRDFPVANIRLLDSRTHPVQARRLRPRCLVQL